MRFNNSTKILIAGLCAINIILLFLLVVKKHPASPVADVYFDDRFAGYTTSGNRNGDSFWNHNAYTIVTCEGKSIDTAIRIINHKNKQLADYKNRLVFRYVSYTENQKDSSLFTLLAENKLIALLTDRQSYTRLQIKKDIYQLTNEIWLFSGLMNTSCEKKNRPYFFYISAKGKIADIYFPNSLNDEITNEYIKQHFN